jgi:hypothetical protein
MILSYDLNKNASNKGEVPIDQAGSHPGLSTIEMGMSK